MLIILYSYHITYMFAPFFSKDHTVFFIPEKLHPKLKILFTLGGLIQQLFPQIELFVRLDHVHADCVADVARVK